MKLLLVILLSAAAAVTMSMVITTTGNYLVERVYCSPQRQEYRAQQTAASFRSYVKEEEVNSTDVEKIGLWNRHKPFVRLIISTKFSVINSNRWGAEMLLTDNGLMYLSTSSYVEDQNFTVNFADGAYTVHIMEFSEERLYALVDVLSLIIGCCLFLVLVLLYNHRVTLAIGKLATQVRLVSRGDLTQQIIPPSKDEIGSLAEDVDALRMSVLEKLQLEEEAWKANSQLITAISHDVRTPLTTLLGYLEILQESLPEAKRQEYLSLCLSKAKTLNELTGELFSYTMLYGKREPETNLEIFDAPTLLAQLLGEMTAELADAGYQVDLQLPQESACISVDIQHLKRIFSNLFSNIRKYANPSSPVEIRSDWVDGNLTVVLKNAFRTDHPKVESTKIGLLSCEKLMTAMGGSFTRHQTEKSFVIILSLPKVEET